MTRVLMAVDAGKHTTKSFSMDAGRINKVSFRTKLTEITESNDLDLAGNSYRVIFKDKQYFVGDMGEDIDYSTSKTNIIHQLATYTAIAALNGDEAAVQLVVGCPISIFKNKELKAEYKSMLMDNGAVHIGVNNKYIRFCFDNILVLPEGSGIVYNHVSFFKNKRVLVVDIGGRNINVAVYNNLVPEISSMQTSELGGFDLEKRLISQLNTQFGRNLTPNDIQTVIKYNGLMINGEVNANSIEVVNSVYNSYINDVFKNLKVMGYDMSLMESVVFVGGTTQMLKDTIKKYVNHAFITEDSQWDNASGFLTAGEAKYNG